jgi:hypothetical protein
MIKETCTLNFNGIPLTYHVSFDPASAAPLFTFEPGSGNRFAPSFSIKVDADCYSTSDQVPDSLWEQAMKKVNMILSRGDQVL